MPNSPASAPFYYQVALMMVPVVRTGKTSKTFSSHVAGPQHGQQTWTQCLVVDMCRCGC